MEFGRRKYFVLISALIILVGTGFLMFAKGIIAFSQSEEQNFRLELNTIVNKSQALTKNYQSEIGKWTTHQINNTTLISITDSYIPKFVDLTYLARNISYPAELIPIYDALVNSLASETDSYKHFRSFLATGNKTEDDISTDLLTRALQNEFKYAEFLSKG
jgi:hypothetical protein